MKFVRSGACIFLAALSAAVFHCTAAFAALSGTPVTPDEIGALPDEHGAYVFLEENFRGSGIEVNDGIKTGAAKADPDWSEISIENGVVGRKVYKDNYINMHLDYDFYEKGDSEFLVKIAYYDYGPGIGYFHFEYNSSDEVLGASKLKKRVSVQKEGKNPGWHTVSILVEDADFCRGMPGDADMRLVTGAYNLFAKIEVFNLSAARREGITIDGIGDSDAKVSAIVTNKILPSAEGNITRAQALGQLYDFLDLTDEIKHDALVSDGDYPADPYMAYALKTGLTSCGAEDFRPNDFITVRELLTFWLRAYGKDDGGAYNKVEQYAKNAGFLQSIDMLYLFDEPLTCEQYAVILYNLMTVDGKSGKSLLVHLYDKGALSYEQVAALDKMSGYRVYYSKPVYKPAYKYRNPASGRIINILDVGGTTVRPYVTEQQWTHDGSRFIVKDNATGIIYEYNIHDETLHYLDYTTISGTGFAQITPDDVMYYSKSPTEIWKMDLNTYERTLLSTVSAARNVGMLSVTDDGKYISCAWYEQDDAKDWSGGANRIRIIPRLNTETGEWDTTLTHEFDEPYPNAGHPLLNPKDGNLVMFCHEGTTNYVHDRIWAGNFTTGDTWNLFKQAHIPGNISLTGETTGHEVWGGSGEYAYFVKYTSDQNVGQSGLCRISKDGEDREYINGDYLFWHCYGSNDDKWVVGDTQEKTAVARVALVSTETYESHLLATFDLPKRSPDHPEQPHPVISPDGHYISWQMRNPETNVLGCAWTDVSDIVDAAPVGGRFEYNDDFDYVSYDGCASSVMKMSDGDAEYIRAPRGCGLYLDATSVKNNNTTVKLEITYLDEGERPINIYYTSGIEDNTDYANREDKVYKLERKNSGKWLTQTFEIDKINLANACKFRTDLRIEGENSQVSVKDIRIAE